MIKTGQQLKKKEFSNLWIIFFVMGLPLLASCISGPKNSTPSGNTSQSSPTSGDLENKVNSANELITGSPHTQAKQGVPYEFIPTSIEQGSIFSGSDLPPWAKVDAATGVMSGTPTTSGVFNSIRIIGTRGSEYTIIGPFSLIVSGDPLYPYQWHLDNTGQSTFSDSGGNSGADLNLSETYKAGYTGVGSTVAVSDSGLEISHEDLDDNLYNFHKNYHIDSPFFGDPSPRTISGDHGTSVAGIIAAEGWNEFGGRGVAPGALVAGLNYIGSVADLERTLDQASGSYSLFNYSYGYSFNNFNFSWDGTYQDLLIERYNNGRQGLGALYIKSAGDSYQECDLFYSDIYNIEDAGICFSHNANFDIDNVATPMIVVGALNANGYRSSYSSVGSSLWISAFGGEFGTSGPAILTTDQEGCGKGYSRTGVSDSIAFMNGSDPLNDECDFTSQFNGTSSAAPMITGVIALMLEANPNLTSRDVKHILAVTADQVNDPNFTGKPAHENSGFFELSGHTYEQGWVTNGAGFTFHNHFGFGKVNGDAAVAMAKTYTSSWGDQIFTNKDFDNSNFKVSPNSSIPDGSATGRSSSLFVSNSLTIENVQILINVTHGRPGDLGIELTSPSGTKSILLNINNSLLLPDDDSGSPVWVPDLSNFLLASNAFYGESSRGTWTLKVIDGLGPATGTEYDNASSQTGTLVDWSINIVGH